MLEWSAVALIGGLLGLDGTSVGQFMISRPLVVGTVVGGLLGDAPTGAAIGALLELYLIVSFPTGGARFPDGASATVAAAAAAVAGDGAGALPIACMIGLVWGQLGGWSVWLIRRRNERMVPRGPCEPKDVVRFHLGAIAVDFFRGALVAGSGAALGQWMAPVLVRSWPLELGASWALVLAGGAVSAGVLARDLGRTKRQLGWLALGVFGGLVGATLL